MQVGEKDSGRQNVGQDINPSRFLYFEWNRSYIGSEAAEAIAHACNIAPHVVELAFRTYHKAVGNPDEGRHSIVSGAFASYAYEIYSQAHSALDRFRGVESHSRVYSSWGISLRQTAYFRLLADTLNGERYVNIDSTQRKIQARIAADHSHLPPAVYLKDGAIIPQRYFLSALRELFGTDESGSRQLDSAARIVQEFGLSPKELAIVFAAIIYPERSVLANKFGLYEITLHHYELAIIRKFESVAKQSLEEIISYFLENDALPERLQFTKFKDAQLPTLPSETQTPQKPKESPLEPKPAPAKPPLEFKTGDKPPKSLSVSEVVYLSPLPKEPQIPKRFKRKSAKEKRQSATAIPPLEPKGSKKLPVRIPKSGNVFTQEAQVPRKPEGTPARSREGKPTLSISPMGDSADRNYYSGQQNLLEPVPSRSIIEDAAILRCLNVYLSNPNEASLEQAMEEVKAVLASNPTETPATYLEKAFAYLFAEEYGTGQQTFINAMDLVKKYGLTPIQLLAIYTDVILTEEEQYQIFKMSRDHMGTIRYDAVNNLTTVGIHDTLEAALFLLENNAIPEKVMYYPIKDIAKKLDELENLSSRQKRILTLKYDRIPDSKIAQELSKIGEPISDKDIESELDEICNTLGCPNWLYACIINSAATPEEE